ncbi:DNA polymerase III gamma subunit [Desulfocucumis palustris]|uniref:DNA-directed DNA polymerase n=1 Tax=Desulfocucumis palustris TaxID=1898651 RepID=A0A2L2XEF5_9FIRM|nr:DNA polymerase III subunit gamma/tau [Desulfocucumis palustris]GBF34384.1 DNA polymerase III gamma subunit [Desulfocucumis palustris]
MAYMALYRQWRPRTFQEVAGQEHIVRTLQNALKSGRVTHAYLFCGPRGTGKTTTAKILAKALNCLDPREAEPCGGCSNCLEIQAGTSMDVIEIDAASNRGIDEVRELRENIRFSPTTGNKRVYIIDEVHMLTDPAFNALLKTLEEPPGHAVFILATTEPHRVPLTILSRCQRFDFHRISPPVMAQRLKEVARGSGIEIEQEALELIVKAADGGLRDGLGMLDQAGSLGSGRVGAEDIHRMLGTVRRDVLEKLKDLIMAGKAGDCLVLLGDIFQRGLDLRLFVREFASHVRALMLTNLSSGMEQPDSGGGPELGKLLEVLDILTGVEQEMKWSSQPGVLLEVALVRCARVYLYGETGHRQEDLRELSARVAELEALLPGLGPGGGERGGYPLPDPPETVKAPAPATVPGEGGVPAVKDKTSGPGRDVGDAGNSGVRPKSSDRGQQAPVVKKKSGGSRTAEEQSVLQAVQKPGEAPGQAAQLLGKIAERWENIMDSVHRSKNCGNIYSYLTGGAGAWPATVAGKVLTVAFWEKDPYSFLAANNMENKDNKDMFTKILKSVCREDLEVRFVISKEEPPAGKQEKTEEDISHDEAAGLFQGEGQEILEDNPFDE